MLFLSMMPDEDYIEKACKSARAIPASIEELIRVDSLIQERVSQLRTDLSGLHPATVGQLVASCLMLPSSYVPPDESIYAKVRKALLLADAA